MVAYDNIEDYDWIGLWWLGANSNYYTNASVSPTASAVLYGVGAGTSAIESDWYVLPNITGLVSTNTHIFQFRLGSYKFTNSAAATAGVDNPDYVEVQLSTDGEITYVTEMRIRGNNNAFWDYNTNATASKTANGLITTYAPAAGGNRTSTGDGYSIIRLQLPAGTTQCAVDIFCRANSAGEEWWIDNVELLTIGPCVPLPIELIEFMGHNQKEYNHITWSTASELNNSHFILERSLNTTEWFEITTIMGNGNSSVQNNYEYLDYSYIKGMVNYYRLKQIDFDGHFEYSNIIPVISLEKKERKIVRLIGIDGREVNDFYKGVVIEIYDDGSRKKVIRQ